ncbi:hypothetical protein [Nonomuraea sp. SYSU D8015]|uniref:hypothetical protein n=1 Tax=Nonomuraea sp. SYSU D8015 TaxID=2593644 RepID=UPI0016606798|nr:hypothetical protein [Nonomuraea sp. SYSU D8015]
MPKGRHRRPARGGISATAEQVALLALIGTLAATCSAVTDVLGLMTNRDTPVVVTAPPATVTAMPPDDNFRAALQLLDPKDRARLLLARRIAEKGAVTAGPVFEDRASMPGMAVN